MRGSIYRSAGLMVALALLLMGAASELTAGTTGKIAGRVVDATTGEPLPGANIVIEGTMWGAATNENGEYFIINVPPGTYSVRAQMIGYAPMVREGVRVHIDLTTTVDFSLRQQVIEGQEVVVTAERPIVQPDIAGSERTVTPVELQSARYQTAANVVTNQVSVTAVGAYEDRPGIRGDAIERSLFIVDGIPQGDPLTQRPYYRVNLDAVEEIKVQTGGFSARYGNLRSGVVNVVTKEGGPRYSGSVNFQYSPPALKHFGPDMFSFQSPLCQPFIMVWDKNGNWDPNAPSNTGVGKTPNGDDIKTFFEGWNNVATKRLKPGDPHYGKPMELYAKWLWQHRSPDAIKELKKLQKMGVVQFAKGVNPDDEAFFDEGVDPDYKLDVTFGGPVPFIYGLKKTTFFLTYYREQTEYCYRAPQRDYREDDIRGKITSWITPAIKLNIHGFWSRQSGFDGGQGPGIDGWISNNPFRCPTDINKFWYPHCAVPGQQTRGIYGVDLVHTLSPKTYYELRFAHYRTDYEMLPEWRNTAAMPGTIGQKAGYYGPVLPNGMPTSGGPSGVKEGCIGTERRADSLAQIMPGWDHWRDWAKIKIGDYWYDESPVGWGPINWRDVTGEYRMESCNVRNNRSYSRSYDLQFSLVSQVTPHHQIDAGFQVRKDKIYQLYETIDPSVAGGGLYLSDADEYWGGVYVQDKMEFSGFIANVGLRGDWLLTGKYPMLDMTAKDDTVKGPWSVYTLPGKTGVVGNLNTYKMIPLERKFKFLVSPRIGISHPISDVAKLFFNYGHMYQWADAYMRYRIQYNTQRGNRIEQFGNPAVAPPRTIQYELGYEHNILNTLLLRVTSYYKDINNEISTAAYYPLKHGGSYAYTTNMRFRDVRGLEGVLELRPDVLGWVSGWTSVNYMVESGGSFGYDQFYEDPSRQPRQVSTQVSKPDVRPLVRVNVMFHTPTRFGPGLGNVFWLLGGIDAGLTYTWKRGRMFTWNPANIPLVEYNLRWKPYQRFDLRVQKQLFALKNVRASFYLDVINLFNYKNMNPYPGSDVGASTDYTWDGHKWWKNQFQAYMYSLGYTPDNEQKDGSFKNTRGKPGDDKGDLPGFTPWTFLETRDVFFGIRFYF